MQFRTFKLKEIIMKNALTFARKYGSKAAAGVTTAMLSAGAFAQASPIDSILDSVSFDGLSTKLVAVAIVVVGIAMVFKGPDLAKRIIRKV